MAKFTVQFGVPKEEEYGLTIRDPNKDGLPVNGNLTNETFNRFQIGVPGIPAITNNIEGIKPNILDNLLGSSSSNDSASNGQSNNPSNEDTTPKPPSTTGSTNTSTSGTSGAFNYPTYLEGAAVQAAGQKKSAAEDALANYGDFTYANQTIIEDVLKQYLNREKFSYNFNEDALYQQYKDKYIQQGKMAMQDTMGQAAALTGGYGNSYAATAGNQAYNASLENLNDIIPELYQMAYDRYNQEGQDMLNKYSLLSDDRATQYGMWSDGYNRLAADRDYYGNAYYNERDFDYGKYSDDRNLAYTDHRNQIGDSQWLAQFDEAIRQYNEQFAYQKDRDAVSDSQWEQEFNYGKEQDATKNNQWQRTYDSSTYDNGGYDTDAIRKAQNFVGADADGMWGSASSKAAKEKGYNSLGEVMAALGISPDDAPEDEDATDYSDWNAGDWEAYFAYIRQTEGKSAAEAELDRMIKAGKIPNNMVAMATIGARGGMTGH